MRVNIDIQPEERKRVYSVNMPPSLYAEIRKEARARGMGFSEYIRVLCEKILTGDFDKSEVRRENTKRTAPKKAASTALSLTSEK